MNAGFTRMNEPTVSASAVLTRGNAPEMARVFVSGKAVAAFTVGARGEWRVTAAGVAARHFDLYFDGQTLFAALAGNAAAVSIDGKPLTAIWTELPDGCLVSFGAASLAVTNFSKRKRRRTPFPTGHAELRGPRILDPFASETLTQVRVSPLAEGRRDLSEEPTVVRPAQITLDAIVNANEPPDGQRANAFDSVAQPLLPPVESPLARTLVRPVTSPMAITMSAPMTSVAPRLPALPAPQPAVGAPQLAGANRTSAAPNLTSNVPPALLHKLIAAAIVAALVLIGVRALINRTRSAPIKAAVTARATPVASASSLPNAHAAPDDAIAGDANDTALSVVDGKTAQRQAVDLVARGAYGEAAIVYERLARSADAPVFREAARIARRKAGPSK